MFWTLTRSPLSPAASPSTRSSLLAASLSLIVRIPAIVSAPLLITNASSTSQVPAAQVRFVPPAAATSTSSRSLPPSTLASGTFVQVTAAVRSLTSAPPVSRSVRVLSWHFLNFPSLSS